MKHATQARTALADQVPIACPNPYELLEPVRVLRKDLNLTSSDVAVLTALVSFLPRDQGDDASEAQRRLTIVFPSNASLSERANGIDERTLRRCLGRLEAAGLVQRKSSANGKRFPLRYGGIIRDAFGIDLTPLIQGHDALAARASKVTEERERLRSLKAEALALRASLLHVDRLDETQLSTLGAIRNLLRRTTLTAGTILQIIADLRHLGADAAESYGERQGPNMTADDVSARNGQNDRHTESTKQELKKDARNRTSRKDPAVAWTDYRNASEFFPDPPRSPAALSRVLMDIGRMLRIRQESLLRGLQAAGPGRVLAILDYLLGRGEAIRRPEAYLLAAVRSS